VTALATRIERARDLLRARFGFPEFRPGQFRAVRAALAGRNALVVLPTGGGKSLCYQIPALVLDGLTVVVSPLISLMQDQVDAARARGIWAAALTSASGPAERQRTLADAERGGLKLLYLAPERLMTGEVIGLLRRLRPSLLAVDEAHCVSEWGEDFRPAYRRIGLARLALGKPPTLALTATATRAVRDDIVASLRLGSVERIVGSFDRPNLFFAVRRVRDEEERRNALLALLRPYRGPSIVYVPTRRLAERWARSLLNAGVAAAPYHAGLEHMVRRGMQDQFAADLVECVVATTAFGLGIDKANVRRVVHLGLATSLEAYYQEAGRAGRDGKRARCEVLWTKADLRLQRLILRDDRKLDPLLRYLNAFGCRRAELLRHFDERVVRCGGCDRCEKWRRWFGPEKRPVRCESAGLGARDWGVGAALSSGRTRQL
jgi:ATP-dependent DNA helicase RecQ